VLCVNPLYLTRHTSLLQSALAQMENGNEEHDNTTKDSRLLSLSLSLGVTANVDWLRSERLEH